jgi:hypothetical protein
MADKSKSATTAHRGMVRITAGDSEAWVVPSSVDAFVRNGWTAEEESGADVQDQPSATETNATSEAAASGTEGTDK